MTPFGWGLLVGVASTLAGAAVAAGFIHQRLLRLERRARHAERLAELGTLTGGLAHEIKNPLSTVQLNLQLLQEDIPPEQPGYQRVAHRLQTVQRETSRLRDILDDFLRYAGKIELDRKAVDLNDLLEELVDFFTPQGQVNRVQVRLKPAAGPVVAPVDAKLIKQAVLNLMLNAVQAMGGTGGRGGELILAASAGRGPKGTPEAVVDIIDTGPGIRPDAVDQIFQAYYSTKAGGTGLGLAMARRIVEEHGGTIAVRSEPGKGSDFTIRLPA